MEIPQKTALTHLLNAYKIRSRMMFKCHRKLALFEAKKDAHSTPSAIDGADNSGFRSLALRAKKRSYELPPLPYIC